MKHVPGLDLAGMALAVLFGTMPGLICQANAQTFSSSYTSTAPKDCRVVSAQTGVDDSTIRTCPGKAGLVDRFRGCGSRR